MTARDESRVERVDAIRERLAKATPGPWERDGYLGVRQTPTLGFSSPKILTGGAYCGEDADLIANAPQDIAYLLDALGQVEAERDALREALTEIADRLSDENEFLTDNCETALDVARVALAPPAADSGTPEEHA